jgi:hypothetical protein
VSALARGCTACGRGAYRAHCALIKHWGKFVALAAVAVLIGVGGQMILGRTAPPAYWIVFGGNTDPGDMADDSGMALEQLIAGGWTTEDGATQVKWAAAIEQGTARIASEAMSNAHAAYDEHCRGGRRCIIAGFSLGNSPALQLAAEVGHPPELTYLFGAPQPATGVFHASSLDNPLVEPWFVTFSALGTDRPVPAGAKNFYDGRDPYANAAPQCNGPGLFALTLDGHRIITKAEADGAARIWAGPDGVENHEIVGGPPLASGADPPAPWALCPPGGWYSPTDTPAQPGPVPVVPGQPETGPGEASSVPTPASSAPASPGLDVPGLDVPGLDVPGLEGTPPAGAPGLPTAAPSGPALPAP